MRIMRVFSSTPHYEHVWNHGITLPAAYSFKKIRHIFLVKAIKQGDFPLKSFPSPGKIV